MRTLGAILMTLGLVAGAAAPSAAACRWDWDCTKGYPCQQVQVCDNTLNSPAIRPPGSVDLPAIKPPAVSPIPGSPVGPLQPQPIPPVGTTKCQDTRMCDAAGNCRWETLCR